MGKDEEEKSPRQMIEEQKAQILTKEKEITEGIIELNEEIKKSRRAVKRRKKD